MFVMLSNLRVICDLIFISGAKSKYNLRGYVAL